MENVKSSCLSQYIAVPCLSDRNPNINDRDHLVGQLTVFELKCKIRSQLSEKYLLCRRAAATSTISWRKPDNQSGASERRKKSDQKRVSNPALGFRANRGLNCSKIKHRSQIFQVVQHLVWREALNRANEFIIQMHHDTRSNNLLKKPDPVLSACTDCPLFRTGIFFESSKNPGQFQSSASCIQS